MRLYREMCAKEEEEEEEEDTPPAGVDSPEDVNDDFGQKHHRFLVGKDDKEDKQLRAKTSYVMDVSTLEENERVKLARVREQQRKDFEIERLKRTVKMLCEQQQQQQRQKGNNDYDYDYNSESDRRNRRKGIDAESVDVLTEYDAELKSREIIIAELREALSETKRNANARTIERKPTSASSSTKLTLNCNTSDEREKRFYSSDESFERVKTLERKTPRSTSTSPCAKNASRFARKPRILAIND